jgi:NAD(P)-dependent dehydrogenase (short-subunit alcohol dehydrogenase family)
MEDKKIVLITGANTGIGFQVVRALFGSSNGVYEVLVGGRSLAKAQQAVQDVTAEFPSTHSHATAIQVDIEDDNSIEAAFKEVQKTFGRLDFLVNNAGKSYSTFTLLAGRLTVSTRLTV